MKTLKSFDWKTATPFKSKHNWDAILDGGIHQLEHGVDFQCKAATFATLVRSAAKKRGLGVRVNAVEGGLVVQAVPAAEGGSKGEGGEQKKSGKGRKGGAA
jgi:hypothetical protein